MFVRRVTLSLLMGGVLLAALAFSGAYTASAKKAAGQSNGKAQETVVTASGKVAQVTVNGKAYHVLQDAAGKTHYYLEVGPPWYYKSAGKAYPLDKYASQQVTVTGVVEQAKAKGPKPGKGNAQAKPAAPTDAPMLSVHTINGEKLRDAGRPPWAGGPKSVPGHPGSKGKGHNKARP